jgi:uncharacterized protein YacL (UPF0231 family)
MKKSKFVASLNPLSTLVILAGLAIHTPTALAYIPPIAFILDQSSKTTGKEIISIDQEVHFTVGNEEAVIKENWLIEGDKNLKVTAQGQGLFKQNINYTAVYNGKFRTVVVAKNRQTSNLNSDFFQKYLFIRSANSFKSYLNDLSILPEVRLSRVDGRVGFAIGQPTESKYNPQIWIDQDEFMVRKIRMPSETEVAMSDFVEFKPGFYIARTQVINWAGVTAKVKLMKVVAKPKESLNAFYPQNLDTPSEITFSNQTPMTQVIQSFYTRFR